MACLDLLVMNCLSAKITISNVKNHKLKIQSVGMPVVSMNSVRKRQTGVGLALQTKENEGHYQSAAREATRGTQDVFLEVRKLGD